MPQRANEIDQVHPNPYRGIGDSGDIYEHAHGRSLETQLTVESGVRGDASLPGELSRSIQALVHQIGA